MKTTTSRVTSPWQHPRAQASYLPLEQAPQPVQAARRHAHATLRAWGIPHRVVDDAVVVISELVTNAYRHTPGGPASLHLMTRSHQLVISVRDTCPGAVIPSATHPDPEQDHGRGLTIVRALAEAFGWDHTDTGKIAWARLGL